MSDRPIFRNVEVRMWDDERFVELSAPPPNAQTLWFYALTNPATGPIPGLYVFSLGDAAERFHWPLKATRAAFAEILAQGMAHYDAPTRVVWLPNAIRSNPPASPNVVRSWKRPWEALPRSELKQSAEVVIRSSVKGIGKGFGQAIDEAFGKGFREGLPEGFREALQEDFAEASGKPFGKPSWKPKANQEQEQEISDLSSYKTSHSANHRIARARGAP